MEAEKRPDPRAVGVGWQPGVANSRVGGPSGGTASAAGQGESDQRQVVLERWIEKAAPAEE
jgi:hypothetical protein